MQHSEFISVVSSVYIHIKDLPSILWTSTTMRSSLVPPTVEFAPHLRKIYLFRATVQQTFLGLTGIAKYTVGDKLDSNNEYLGSYDGGVPIPVSEC